MIASNNNVAHADIAEVLTPNPNAALATGRVLLNQLPWAGNQLPDMVRTLGVTSSRSGEGVSTVALQLAWAAALPGEHAILIVDCHSAKPAIDDLMNVAGTPGLTDVLFDRRPPAEVIQASCLPALSVLAAGNSRRGDIDSGRLSELIKLLEQDYQLVIFDLPPVDDSSESLGMAAQLDGILYVVEAERVQHSDAQRKTELLQRAGARIVGAVLNKQPEYLPNWLQEA